MGEIRLCRKRTSLPSRGLLAEPRRPNCVVSIRCERSFVVHLLGGRLLWFQACLLRIASHRT